MRPLIAVLLALAAACGSRDPGGVEIRVTAGAVAQRVDGPFKTRISWEDNTFPAETPLTMRVYADVEPPPPGMPLSRQVTLLPRRRLEAGRLRVQLGYDVGDAEGTPVTNLVVYELGDDGKWTPVDGAVWVAEQGFVLFESAALTSWVAVAR